MSEDNFEHQTSQVKNMLRHHIHPSVKKITLSAENDIIPEEEEQEKSDTMLPIQEYVDAVFSRSHVGVDCIEFVNGELKEYEVDEDMVRGRGSNIKNLIFNKTQIYRAGLTCLSSDLPKLDLLRFDACQFGHNSSKKIILYCQISLSKMYSSLLFQSVVVSGWSCLYVEEFT